jgi:hypothetical protein
LCHKDIKEHEGVDYSGPRWEQKKLTQNVDKIGDIWTSENYIDKAPNKMMTVHQIRERIIIKST